MQDYKIVVGMNKPLNLLLKAITFAIAFLIIDLTAWYRIFANYNISLYSCIFGDLSHLALYVA